MSNEFIVHTGSIIQEYIDEIGFDYKECANQLDISEKELNDLFNGKISITPEIARKLEKIIKDVPASYWINYENKYQKYLQNTTSNYSQKYSIYQLRKYSKRFRFNSVFKGLNWDLYKQANEMLKILGLTSFEEFDNVYSNLNVDFMEDGGEKEAIAIWLNLAMEEVELQNPDLSGKQFDKNALINSLEKFKLLALNTDYKKSIISARKLLNQYGVYLVLLDAIENSKVRGALTTYNNNPAIFLTARFKTHDHVWFALMHEIGHLIYHYLPNNPIISFEDELYLLSKTDINTKEEEANEFARDFFINKSDYKKFIENQKFDKQSISNFAKSQNVLPGIVVARLQHDGYIGFDQLNYLKNK